MYQLALASISLCKTGTYNQDEYVSLAHVSKVSPLAPFLHRAREGDILKCRYN